MSLSPGQWHRRVPKERGANLRFRRRIIQLCRENPAYRAAVIRACREDILFYICLFVWQTNPRHKRGDNEDGPFITWDFQDEAVLVILAHIEADEDLLIEKSREMGASWLCLIIMDWLCLFHRRKSFLCISHSEEAVDNGEVEHSLLPKIAFMHDHLPDWLIGEERKAMKRKMKFRYKTNSNIKGTATSVRSGVGSRTTGQFLDEFSKQKDDYEILGQTADVGCRIFNGTHYGLGTAFYELTRRPDLHKLVMHWSQHPEKNRGLYRFDPQRPTIPLILDKSYEYPPDYKFILDGTPAGGPHPGLRSPWYDKECLRRANARDVAMHLDINPEGSVSQFFDAALVRQHIDDHCRAPFWEGDLVYDKDTAQPIELVPRIGGPLHLWCMVDRQGRPGPGPYAAGADIAEGTGATPSCLSIAHKQTREKVLEYTNPFISAEDFAPLSVALCRLFDNADFCWEMQGPGIRFGLKVVELGYRNIYYRHNDLKPFMLNRSDTPGWYPSPEARRLTLEAYRTAIRTCRFINRSERALKECLAFIYTSRGDVEHGGLDSQDFSGARVNHGDHVIADALCHWMMEKSPVTSLGAPEQPVPQNSIAGRMKLHEDRRRREEAWA